MPYKNKEDKKKYNKQYYQNNFKKCWALKNLQLLPAKENTLKGNKLTKQFQPSLQISFKS